MSSAKGCSHQIRAAVNNVVFPKMREPSEAHICEFYMLKSLRLIILEAREGKIKESIYINLVP